MTCVIIKIFPRLFKFLESQQKFTFKAWILCCDFNKYNCFRSGILVVELQIDIGKEIVNMFECEIKNIGSGALPGKRLDLRFVENKLEGCFFLFLVLS